MREQTSRTFLQRTIAAASLVALVASGCSSRSAGLPSVGSSATGGGNPQPTPCIAAGLHVTGRPQPGNAPMLLSRESGCTGGGVSPTPQPTPTPGKKATTVGLHVTIPNKLQDAIAQAVRRGIAHRMARMDARSRSRFHPHYISPSSAGVAVIITQGATNIGTYTFNVSSGSPNCTGNGTSRTCSLTFPLSPGTYSLAMTFYDAYNSGTGTIPGTANALSTATVSATIIANTANTINFDLEGIIAGLSGLTFTSVPNGQSSTTALAIAAVDADGNPITANASHPYENPITVSLTSGTAHASLVKNGTNVGSSATLNYSTDAVSVSYDGNATSAAYGIVASIAASGAPTQTADVSPMIVTVSPASSLAFTDAGQTQTVTVTENNAPSTNGYNVGGWSCQVGGAATKFGLTKTVTNSGGTSTYTVAITSPAAVTGSTLLNSYGCSDLSITDSTGNTMTSSLSPALAFSSNIPVTQQCASDTTANDYLDAKTGGNYITASGSLCTFAVPEANNTYTLYLPPGNGGAHPAQNNITTTENNDVSSVTTAGCGTSYFQAGDITNNTTPGTVPTGNLSGNINVAVGVGDSPGGPCTMIVKDGNGQSNPVYFQIEPTVQTGSASTTYKTTCTSSGPPTNLDWACTAGINGGKIWMGTNGSTEYDFANTTNAANMQMTISGTNNSSGCMVGQGQFDVTLTDTSNNNTWTITSYAPPDGTNQSFTHNFSGDVKLPDGAGTYSIQLTIPPTACGGYANPGDWNGSVSISGSLYTATQGSGTVVPSFRTMKTRRHS